MQTPAPTSDAQPVSAPFTPLQWLMLTLLCSADCMVVLDFSIVNVAIPSIQKALGFSPESVQWLFTGYGLVFGGFLLLGGRLSDLYGRKRTFLTGTGLFVFASFLGGFAQSPAFLVAMRCLQGLGAAFLAPSAMALLMGVFPEGPQRNRAFGIWGTVAAAGYSLGVILGGVLTAYLGWRWILFVNVPFGLVIILAGLRILREPEAAGERPSLDLLGSVLVTGGLMLMVYALVMAHATGWTSLVTWRLFGLAFLLLLAFVWVEKKSTHPIMPLRIFKLPGIAAANMVCTLISAAMVAMNLILTLYFQQVLDYSPLMTGLAFLPHGLAAIVAGPLGGTLATRVGSKTVLLAGTSLALISMVSLAFLSTRDSYWIHILPATMLMSFGIMPAFVTLMLLATNGAKAEDHGLVSGIVNTTGQLGGALGLAVLVAVAAGRTTGAMAEGLPALEAILSGYRWALATAACFLAVSLAFGWIGLKKSAEAN